MFALQHSQGHQYISSNVVIWNLVSKYLIQNHPKLASSSELDEYICGPT